MSVHNQNKNRRVAAILIAIVIILVGLGVYAHFKHKAIQRTETQDNQTYLPAPKAISPFKLTDDSGKPFTNDNLKGRWSMVFFGFTHCGQVCPVTLTELNKMYQLLEKDLASNQLPQIVFISVDPERDSQKVIHNYIKNFNPDFIGATADTENLNIFIKELGLYYNKTDGKNSDNYGVNHSSQIFIFNPNGDWVGFASYPSQSNQLAKNYETMIKKNGQTNKK